MTAQIANKKLKQDTQTTNDSDDMQAIFQQLYVAWVKGAPSPQPSTLQLRLQPRDIKHFKTKTVQHFPSLAPCDFFNNFTFYLHNQS